MGKCAATSSDLSVTNKSGTVELYCNAFGDNVGEIGCFPRVEVGVQVSLNDVLDCPAVARGCFDVNANVALRIDDGSNALRGDHVGSMGQTAQIESFDAHRSQSDSSGIITIECVW